MKMRELTTKDIDIKKIEALRRSVGWRKKRTNKKWKEILFKSSFVYSVWDDKELIGMGRILEDGMMCMFYDIAVHKDYQNKGVGKKIMERLVREVKNKKYTSIGIFASKENITFLSKFYKKFGFEKVNTGMELKKYMK